MNEQLKQIHQSLESLTISVEQRFDKMEQQLSILIHALHGHQQRLSLIERVEDHQNGSSAAE